jgi:sugar phosphate isomerase/epimerase
MSYPFRHSICNEVFEHWNFADTCKATRKIGYAGIEIAPFTLNENPNKISASERREYRSAMDGEGLEFVGLHWLMVAPKGLHVTTPDKALRERSWRHIEDLIDLCADLAGDAKNKGIMVFGSPKQRCTVDGATRADATQAWRDGLAQVASHAGARGVTILVEALPSNQCDVVTTIEEAAGLVREIDHAAIRTMFDTHNAADEREPHAVVLDRYFDLVRHIHVNEMDGRHPGAGDYDFLPVLDVLRRRSYHGWVSLEVFDFSFGAERIAAESLRYLESVAGKIAA